MRFHERTKQHRKEAGMSKEKHKLARIAGKFRKSEIYSTRKVLLAAAAAGMVFVATARAELRGFYSGEDLAAFCTEEELPEIETLCLGYVAAVADIVTSQGFSKFRVCRTEIVSVGEAEKVVKRWLDEHKSQLHLPAHIVVAKALAKAYPCK